MNEKESPRNYGYIHGIQKHLHSYVYKHTHPRQSLEKYKASKSFLPYHSPDPNWCENCLATYFHSLFLTVETYSLNSLTTTRTRTMKKPKLTLFVDIRSGFTYLTFTVISVHTLSLPFHSLSHKCSNARHTDLPHLRQLRHHIHSHRHARPLDPMRQQGRLGS